MLVPRPSYPLFDYLASLESVAVGAYPLAYDGEWHLDRGALEAAVTPRTRAVVAVHPNNPTGSFLNRGEGASLRASAPRPAWRSSPTRCSRTTPSARRPRGEPPGPTGRR